MTKTRRDYYRVLVPSDAAPDLRGLGELAIDEARERARLYCVPASWYAKPLHLRQEEIADGSWQDRWEIEFRVTRVRNAKPETR